MKNYLIKLGFLGITIALLIHLAIGIFHHFSVKEKPVSQLTVSAAISLQEGLTKIKNLYELAHPDQKITYNFGSSGSLQQQIERGAPIDVFIAAAPAPMNSLEKQGLLLKGTRHDLVKNTIVLIVNKNNQKIKTFPDLNSKNIDKIAIGEPSIVPAGKYAIEVLTFFGLWPKLQPKIVYTKDVRQVVTYVATGNVEAGIVYQTEARVSSQVKIVAVAPSHAHTPVVYPIAVLKNSDHIIQAQELVKFLLGPIGQKTLAESGLLVN